MAGDATTPLRRRRQGARKRTDVRGRFLFLLLVLVTVTPAWVDSATAAFRLGRAGNIGGHGLTDSRESPGVTCRFAPPLDWSLGGTWIQVRPPVMFARDVSEGVDEQQVGWRATIVAWDRDSQTWQRRARGEIQYAVAADNRAANFDSRGPETTFFLGYGAYQVTMQLFWYEGRGPDGAPKLAGQAEYQLQHYALAVRDRIGTQPLGVETACELGMTDTAPVSFQVGGPRQ
jgi:hypothetical protein